MLKINLLFLYNTFTPYATFFLIFFYDILTRQKKAKTDALSNANKMRDELLAMDEDNMNDQVIHILKVFVETSY